MTLPWMEGKSPRILVLGDLILDEYVEGTVSRVSPEAPVPIHQVDSMSYSLGGAANTARNIKLCGGDVLLMGPLGKDSTGKTLESLLLQDGIPLDGLLKSEDYQTTKKTRITSLRQQLLRMDWEKKSSLEEAHAERVLETIQVLKPKVIVLSDYQKGFLTRDFITKILSLTNELKLITVVDPKLEDFGAYKGCTLITPNLLEAKRALQLEQEALKKEEVISKLRDTFELKNILLTLGPEGMLFSGEGGELHYEAAEKREVYDVSGAGDTVVALMALSFAAHLKPKEAMSYANLAASLAVSKWKTQAVTSRELQSEWEKKQSPSFTALKDLKRQGKRLVFTNGCFDVLHYGHVSYLERAKELGDYLVVGLNSDASVKRLKGQARPINPLEYRKKTLEGLRSVDLVIPFEEDTPAQLITALCPDILVKGADYKKSEIVGAEYVLSYGGKVETINFIEGLSSSKLIEKRI